MRTTRWAKQMTAMAAEHGFTLHRDGKHLIFRNDRGVQIVVPKTPSDGARTLLNTRADFRRGQRCVPEARDGRE